MTSLPPLKVKNVKGKTAIFVILSLDFYKIKYEGGYLYFEMFGGGIL